MKLTAAFLKTVQAKSKRGWGNEDGSSLVEFSLCLPPLMLLMTGIFSFGIATANYGMLTNATGVAAMQVAMSRQQTLDPCAVAAAAVYASAPTLKQASFTFSYVFNGVSYSGTSCSSASNTTGAAGNLVQGQTVQITVTYPCSLVAYKMLNNFPTCLLTAKSSELVQ
jgi:Flp pilus assembly protein TadG